MIHEEIKIVTEKSASGLASTVNALLKQGWKRLGSHQVVTTFEQRVFAGMQHRQTTYTHEYSLTLVREVDSDMVEYKPQINA